MEHIEQTMDKAHSASESTKKPRKQEPAAKLIALLEQCQKDIQTTEQRLAEAQLQLELTRSRLSTLQGEIIQSYASPPQTDPIPLATVEHIQETPATEPIYPTYGLYAYGLVKKSPGQLDIPGIDTKNKVYPVKGSGICVMVSEINISQFQEQVKNLYAVLAQTPGVVNNEDGAILQAHEHVIDTIMQHTTIVPLKFGTILKDKRAAVKLLVEQGEDFKALLAKFEGKVECGLKVYVDIQVAIQHITRHDPELARQQEQQESLSKGTAYLFARKREEQLKDRANAELSRIGEHIFTTFGTAAFEMKQNDLLAQKVTGKKKEMILNAAYLVGRDNVVAFQEQAKKITAQYSPLELELEFSGPWPPYNFM
ncbi:hypothetical protein KDW_06270 [Dictyobacter vulcani]|uniref:Protein gvpL n=1 Tax=Dictyobacter vulcani TaxID=2607529 RepID=A0A5J4KG93_9CHLR|nr:GvpL/GvpF family gas vesicle protein [Dictyobacter vulcani]GER86465.1 hypothetical protein KDW_06270 [Dictyobacter vulcani]